MTSSVFGAFIISHVSSRAGIFKAGFYTGLVNAFLILAANMIYSVSNIGDFVLGVVLWKIGFGFLGGIFGGFFLGVPLMVLLAGPEFIISGDIIKILLIATGIISIAGLFGYAAVALNQQKKMIKFYAVNAVISTIGYLIFIPLYSYWGAAWMTVFSEIFILITACYILYQSQKFLPNLKILIKSILASLIMSIPLYFLPNLFFPIAICLGALVYFVALYLLKGIDRKAVLEIIKRSS